MSVIYFVRIFAETTLFLIFKFIPEEMSNPFIFGDITKNNDLSDFIKNLPLKIKKLK